MRVPNAMENRLALAAAAATLLAAFVPRVAHAQDRTTVRVAAFNVEDVRTEDIRDPSHPRLKRLAEVIQRIRPSIVLLGEIAYDGPGAPGTTPGAPPGRNAQRFADTFLAVAQAPDVRPLRYRAFMAPTNTGQPSGIDLDRSGSIVSEYPAPAALPATGEPAPPSPSALAYAGDCWGFGTFPGQYGMALLVDERFTILTDRVRTFRLLPWDYMPGALLPTNEGGSPWFTDAEKQVVRLSSKSHWDVPVMVPGGGVLHVLCSHPTPPAFDGPEKRNARRNHDEIRLWADYIAGEPYLVDDSDTPGGLVEGSWFVILGDLNADPTKGESFKDPVGTLLLANPRINPSCTPMADVEVPGLEPADTAAFRMRVDYVLPSRQIEIARCGIWRRAPGPAGTPFPSDHFPVWAELVLPALAGSGR